jgi:hypothetical protein
MMDFKTLFLKHQALLAENKALKEENLSLMDFKTLFLKHQALLAENKALKEENLSLMVRLGLAEPPESRSSQEGVHQDASPSEPFLTIRSNGTGG